MARDHTRLLNTRCTLNPGTRIKKKNILRAVFLLRIFFTDTHIFNTH